MSRRSRRDRGKSQSLYERILERQKHLDKEEERKTLYNNRTKSQSLYERIVSSFLEGAVLGHSLYVIPTFFRSYSEIEESLEVNSMGHTESMLACLGIFTAGLDVLVYNYAWDKGHQELALMPVVTNAVSLAYEVVRAIYNSKKKTQTKKNPIY